MDLQQIHQFLIGIQIGLAAVATGEPTHGVGIQIGTLVVVVVVATIGTTTTATTTSSRSSTATWRRQP